MYRVFPKVHVQRGVNHPFDYNRESMQGLNILLTLHARYEFQYMEIVNEN